MRMQFYTTVELVQILNRQADKLIEAGGRRCRRSGQTFTRDTAVAGRLCGVRDIALVDGQSL